MKSFGYILAGLGICSAAGFAADLGATAWDLEAKGDAAGARSLLQREAQATGATPETLKAYAEFLDRHHDPGARAAYRHLLSIANGPEKIAAARRLALLDVFAEDRPAAEKDLSAFTAAGGSGLALPPVRLTPAEKKQTIQIPGPLRSFSRMAALSPDLKPDDLLPALTRNIVTNGYQAASSNEALEQTEFLKLIVRYLTQARELDKLSGPTKTIQIATCDSSQTNDLLRVLGYRMRGGCGSDVVLETVNATRAFLTIDSGLQLDQPL